jgi:hypothetical protein
MAELSTNTCFTALDIFRGLTVCFTIIVNSAGNGETSYCSNTKPLNPLILISLKKIGQNKKSISKIIQRVFLSK